jgi:uncharacterized repeat protein (TIGR04076 family)
MPFKVKTTLIGFLGNTKRYPCHFNHKVGDEVIFDGEKYIGRLCPDVWPLVVPRVAAIFAAGPRYFEPIYYSPFWYAPLGSVDPNMKKYDGLGFKNVLETIKEPPYCMTHLVPPNSFKWPPHKERTVAKDIIVICPDARTSTAFKLEAFDLADKGYALPFFRRMMTILDKVLKKQGIKTDKIIDEYSKKQREEIYPALSPQIMVPLLEELVLMKYLNIKKGKAVVTPKGEAKLKNFKTNLSSKEREALEI